MTALRWMEGMREAGGALCIETIDGRPTTWIVDGDFSDAERDEVATPALGHPATVGCVAAQARRAWSRPHLHVQAGEMAFLEDDAGVVCWFVRDGVDALPPEIAQLPPAGSEGEAWLACLEAAP